MSAETVPEQQIPGRARQRRRLSIIFIYAGFAALWILLSDEAVVWFFRDPALIALASTLKGWLFVGITSLLLYVLMGRWVDGTAEFESRPADSRRLALPFALLAVVIVAFSVSGIFNAFIQQKETEIARLEAIANLKTREITDWLKERQGDADFVRTSDFFAGQYLHWQESGDKQSAEMLQIRLEQFRQIRGFSAVTLLNSKGKKLWGSDKSPLTIAPPLEAAAQLAAADHKTRRIGPYRGRAGNLRLDFIAPLTALPGQAPLVILHINVADWLYPVLQTWPIPSTTGETLLFRRDGNQVLFLNELRHQKYTAATLRIPLTTKKLLAAQLIRGDVSQGEPVEGVDYRDVPVIGVARAISGTNWFLIAKVDKSELYAKTAPEAAWIALVGLLALLIAGGGLYLSRQNQQLALSKAVRQSQDERINTLQLLAAIADSSDDSIYAKDIEGRFTLFNRAAGQTVGKAVDEVLGRDVRDIFPSGQAEMLMTGDRQVIAENRTITYEETLSTSRGDRVFLDTRGPLHDAGGKIVGLFGIARDITGRKRAEMALISSEERFRWFFMLSPIPLNIVNMESSTMAVNNQFISTFGYTLEDMPTLAEWWLLAYPDPEYRYSMMDNWNSSLQGMKKRNIASEPIEAHVTCKDGGVRTVIISRILIGNEVLSTFVDITELRQTVVELQERNNELERFNRVTVGRELDMISLKQQINALFRQLGREPPYPLSFLDDPSAQQRGEMQ
jgi:PAS domain S-box-containing protein